MLNIKISNRFRVISPLRIIILFLLVVSFILITRGFLFLNIFDNRFLSFTYVVCFQYILYFFVFSSVFIDRGLKAFLGLRVFGCFLKKGGTVAQPTLKWEKRAISIFQKSILVLISVFVVFVSTICSVAFTAKLIHEKEYRMISQVATELYQKQYINIIERQIQFKLRKEKVWNDEDLISYLKKSLSGDLMTLYNRSAAYRVLPYLQVSPKEIEIGYRDRLTKVNPYVHPSFAKYSEDTKQDMQVLVDTVNSVNYNEYLGIYNEYCELVREYECMIQYSKSQKASDLEKFNLDSLLKLDDTIDELKLQIISPEDEQVVRSHYHQVKVKDLRKLEPHSDSCIARLESLLTYRDGKEENGLQNGRRIIIYDCEDVFLQLYDKLNELQKAIKDLILIGFGGYEVLSSDAMLELIEYGALQRDGEQNDVVDCALLKDMHNQLVYYINYQHSDDYENTQLQLKALSECITLYALLDDLDSFQERMMLTNKSLTGIQANLNQISEFYVKTGMSKYQSDIEILQNYCLSDDFVKHLYFLIFLPQFNWIAIDLSPKFLSLHQSVVRWLVFYSVYYMCILILGGRLQGWEK